MGSLHVSRLRNSFCTNRYASFTSYKVTRLRGSSHLSSRENQSMRCMVAEPRSSYLRAPYTVDLGRDGGPCDDGGAIPEVAPSSPATAEFDGR